MRRTPRPGSQWNVGRLKTGFVLLVGLSGGLMAFQGGASILVVVLATIGGLLAGGALLWYLLWIAG